jgi:hypothetical protein
LIYLLYNIALNAILKRLTLNTDLGSLYQQLMIKRLIGSAGAGQVTSPAGLVGESPTLQMEGRRGKKLSVINDEL